MRVNDYGQPLGDPVVGWTTRPAPTRLTLRGESVTLEPAAPAHAEDLQSALGRPADDALWTYRPDHRPSDVAGMSRLLGAAQTDPSKVTWALLPASSGRAEGLATLMRIDQAQGCIEVGAIIFAGSLQRTRAATEAMALLARHVFDDLGYRRYEWKCDSLNQPSRAAALRLGFTYEGRFRQAVVYKGRNRDTDWFAMTDADWPAISAAYDAWLDPGNFDEDDVQRAPLSRFLPDR